MYFEFSIRTRHKSVSCDNGKMAWKKMSKLFTCDYLPAQYNMAKFLGNVSFEETNTEPSIQKIDGIWLLWGIFTEYIK